MDGTEHENPPSSSPEGQAEVLVSQKRGSARRGSAIGAFLGQVPAPQGAIRDDAGAEPVKTVGNVANQIARRYSAVVQETEKQRRAAHIPLEQQVFVTPTDFEVARTVKKELDIVSSRNRMGKGAVGSGWSNLFNDSEFQRKLQFMCTHARTGHFIERYGSEGQYEGDFLYGMRHGKGTHEFRGDVYEGDWKWDHRHGWGMLTLNDGSTFKGNWEKGKSHGFTSITNKTGKVVYEGEMRDGKRHGLGRQEFENGDQYDGCWEQGRLNERGVYYFLNGDKLHGMWKNGLYHGVGVFHYVDGSISRRVYKDGLLMSVQDYEADSQRFGKTLTRGGMQKHTTDGEFPKDVFLLG